MADSREKDLFGKLLGDRKIIIADTQAAARSSIAKTLRELGAKTSSIVLVATYDEAVQEIEKTQAPAIIADYNLGDHCGLKLLHHQRRWYPNTKDRLFVVVTTNSRETAIAEAAEEEVDCYILKPFTMTTLRDHMLSAVLMKVNPTPYRRAIEDGKAQLMVKEAKKASELFLQAIRLTEKPSLAYYYHGRACMLDSQLPQAEESYNGGLVYNDKHYRCLTGLYDLFLQTERLDEAYQVAKRIVFTFPVSPQRLDSILRLAVKSRQFNEIDAYYEIYVEMDYRTPELTKVMTASMVVAGKYYVSRKDPVTAVAMMKKGMIVSSRNTPILREIITAFCAARYFDEADIFLKEFPPDQQAGPVYHAMDLLILDGTGTASSIIDKGRKLIEKGMHDPTIYEILIRRSTEAKLDRSAESMAFDAARRWPESRARFLALLGEDSAPKAGTG